MKNTIFIEKSYIVASILNVKSKYLRKDFVTTEELNYISNQIQKKFNEQNFNAIILDKIDTDYFEVSDVIKINKSEGLLLESIINRYQGYLSLGILLLIWDEKTILDYLFECITNETHDEKQKFDVLAVPCNRAFVVAPDKVEEFKNLKTNPEVKKQIEENAKKLNINNDDCPTLRKIKKQKNKKGN